ncbi:MAG TPA: hypothetical protein VF753_04005 [Terriglobales bacterium]
MLVALTFGAYISLVASAWMTMTNMASPIKQNSPQSGQSSSNSSQSNARNQDALAVIEQSGSTNTRAYKVTIRNDGSATAEIAASVSPAHPQAARSQEFPAATIDAKTLRQLLTEIDDVSKIPIGPCAKPASFGTRTLISYAGNTSGDLQCVRGIMPGATDEKLELYENLSQFVAKILRDLKVNTSRRDANP